MKAKIEEVESELREVQAKIKQQDQRANGAEQLILAGSANEMHRKIWDDATFDKRQLRETESSLRQEKASLRREKAPKGGLQGMPMPWTKSVQCNLDYLSFRIPMSLGIKSDLPAPYYFQLL